MTAAETALRATTAVLAERLEDLEASVAGIRKASPQHRGERIHAALGVLLDVLRVQAEQDAVRALLDEEQEDRPAPVREVSIIG